MSSNHHDNRIFEFPQQNNVFDTELAYAENRRSRRGCCGCGCCLGCLGLLILIILGIIAFSYAILGGGADLVVSEETTIITDPDLLKSDGKTVDFHRVIQTMIQPDVQPDENGFMTVWRGYDREIFDFIDREDFRQQYLIMCDQLGINLQAQPTWSLPSEAPWAPGAHGVELAEQWLAQASEGLDAVQAAVAQPHYFVPLVRESEKDLVVMSQPLAIYAFHERLSNALRIRFLLESGTDGAWKDMLTSMRLFRLVTINQAWLEELTGRDSETLLTPVAAIVDMLPQWTPEQLEKAIKDLESLPDWQDRQTMLKTVQFMLLDTLSVTGDLSALGSRIRIEIPEEAQNILQAFQIVGFDWNVTAKELNRMMKDYGELLERVAGNSLEEQFNQLGLCPIGEPHSIRLDEEELQAFVTDYLQRTGENPLFAPGRSRLVGAIQGFLGTRAAGAMYRLQLMEESRCQALRLALTLEQFRKEKGQYPNSLEELGLRPMALDMHLQYEKRGNGYRIWNMVVQLMVE